VTATVQGYASLLLLWAGALMVLGGSLTLGSMLALVSLAGLFLAPLASLVEAGISFQQVGGHLERIASVLRAAPEQQRSETRPPHRLEGRIELEQVSFRYDEAAPWAVRNLSLSIMPGQKVALVGATGSGKTTVAKLVLGFYPPTEGTVWVDGQDLHELDLRLVRSQFGVVTQEPKLVNGSIRQNISYNDRSLPLEHIVQAAKLAELHDEIEQLPMGYETLVAEDGSALSGGQRQRLAIARALARQPRLMVLDEATSSLDAATERRVADHLAAVDASMLIIVHRLSTVQNADQILVLSDGLVRERGTHAELLAERGAYAPLVHDQFVDGGAPLER
jgi:ABC-type bacteriocin/lantibiotic exporter with double-glycine peptidase domain